LKRHLAKGAISAREKHNRLLALRLLILQSLVAFALVILALLLGKDQALAALTGTAIAISGNVYFSWRSLRPLATQPLNKLASNFYQAVFGKYLIVLVLFTISFKFMTLLEVPQNALLMLVAFIVTHGVMSLASLLESKMGFSGEGSGQDGGSKM